MVDTVTSYFTNMIGAQTVGAKNYGDNFKYPFGTVQRNLQASPTPTLVFSTDLS